MTSTNLPYKIKDLQSIGKLFNNRYYQSKYNNHYIQCDFNQQDIINTNNNDFQNNPQLRQYENHIKNDKINPLFNNLQNLSKSIATNTPRSRKLSPIMVNSSYQMIKERSLGKIINPQKLRQSLSHTPFSNTQSFYSTRKQQGILYQSNNHPYSENDLQLDKINKKIENQKQYQYQHLVGKIKDLTKLRPKSPKIIENLTSSQLPYLKKINHNINGFKKFIGNSTLSNPNQVSYHITLHNNNKPSLISSSIDPNYQNSLNQHPKKQFVHLPMFKIDTGQADTGQGLNDRQIQSKYKLNQHLLKKHQNHQKKIKQTTKFDYNGISLPMKALRKQDKMYPQAKKQEKEIYQISKQKLNNTYKPKVNHYLRQEEFEQSLKNYDSNNKSNELTYSRSKKDIADSIVIGMQTSLAVLKEILIQSKQKLDVSFRIPDAFINPPSSSTNQKELQQLMIKIFDYVNLKPHVISIYKYSNCVMMKQKDLCVLWHFNGKVYFGGWKSETVNSISDGKKDGLGLQWVPQKYVYYGQFIDGKKSGYGIMKKFNKQIYIGQWKDNQRQGWGKIYQPQQGKLLESGQFYEGKLIKQGYLH